MQSHLKLSFNIIGCITFDPVLVQGEEKPQCVGCDAQFTVRHFLLECGDFAQVRNNCFHVNNMKIISRYTY